MDRGMGYNIHLSYTSDSYWAQLLDRFAVDKPAALLLLDSFGHGREAGYALDAARLLPDTLIIYRKFLQGDHQYRYLSPAQWVAEHQAFVGTRVYCSADNEPDFVASLPWLLEVAKAAKAANLRVSLGGWSVGGYQIADIPKMEALLRYTADAPSRYVYDFHEYTRGSWTVDFAPHEHNPANWPDLIPPDVNLWVMGRFRQVLRFCDTKGIKRPQIVCGEYGFDRVLAVETTVYGNVGALHTLPALFKRWGYENWEAYAAVQLQAAYQAIYAPHGIPVCYYQLSDHPDNWREFNAYYAPTFMDATRKGFDMTTPTPVTYTPYAAGTYTLVGSGVRVRTAPDLSAPYNHTANSGARVEVAETAITPADDYGWQRVHVDLGGGYVATGWMALRGTKVTWSLTPVTTDPEAERKAQLLKWAGELETIAAEMRSAAQ
jgi:hypothetical protein